MVFNKNCDSYNFRGINYLNAVGPYSVTSWRACITNNNQKRSNWKCLYSFLLHSETHLCY